MTIEAILIGGPFEGCSVTCVGVSYLGYTYDGEGEEVRHTYRWRKLSDGRWFGIHNALSDADSLSVVTGNKPQDSA